ncbi:MAG: hypothetical protein CVU56_22585 [Deltaproteobacteria bacterium HGW-Deltaproteobacteria-14]|nr:MAG: hypothetical protein CVU56_22585 [Deltaproteobacteria bacterium HGW-Deltaproteobacteria-14]
MGLTVSLTFAACGDDSLGSVDDTAGDALADTALPADTATSADTLTAADTAAPADSAVAIDSAAPTDTATDTAADTAAAADTSLADTTPADTSPPADTTPADTSPPADTAVADTSTACTANPFTPQGPTEDWDHGIQTPITLAFGDPNHRGQDVVVKVGEPQLLIGKFAYGFIDKDLKEENVEVWIQRDPPCGAWELLDIVRTSTDGQYGTQYGIEDDGGRVFYTVPSDRALPVGRYPVRMVVRGDHSLASFDLIVVTPGTEAVVFDIDGTLTTDDSELINEITQSIFNNTYDEAVRAAAVETVTAWHDKGYLVVYLTGRPDLLRPMTEAWLEAHGFPPGPLHLTDTNGQVLPTNGGVGDYKTAFLAYLAGTGGLSVYAAYGNATTDIYAFGNAAIPKARTFIAGPHGGEEGTVNVGDDYQAHLPTAQGMPTATALAPPDLGWW